MAIGDGLALDERDRLPDALRVLLDEYPRDAWATDPGFHGLVSFWLERHLTFRRLLSAMNAETESLLDGGDPHKFAQRLSRYGSIFIQDLHGHHQIEDQVYFPQLITRDTRLRRGFSILDKDHQALDGLLETFANQANAALVRVDEPDNLKTAVGRFYKGLADLTGLIDRHLSDEEDLIVPVILKFGSDDLH